MPTPLRLATLAEIKKTASVPAYARGELSAGIVHIGVGNFHRAHQAVYLDALFNMGKSRDWGVIGTGVRPADRAMYDALKPQGRKRQRRHEGRRWSFICRVARVTGLEPATSGVTGRRSNQLSYTRVVWAGE